MLNTNDQAVLSDFCIGRQEKF